MKAPFRVKPYKHPRLKWVVRGKVNGVWERRFFEREKEAKEHASVRNTEALAQGTDALVISAELRAMALRCAAMLSPYGKTIETAAVELVARLKTDAASQVAESVLSEWLEAKKAEGRSQDWITTIEHRGGRLVDYFRGRLVSSITTREVSEFLAQWNHQAPVTRNNNRMVATSFFAFAKTRGYCTENPAWHTPYAVVVDKPPGIITPADLLTLLVHIPEELLPIVAIGAFAGLRTSEISRLTWDEVNLASGFINVAARKTKTARRRVVKIEPVLAAWLRGVAKTSGPVVPPCWKSKLKWFKRAATKYITAPHNWARHSYASYHLAKYKDSGRLACELGHTGAAMLYRHYREVVSEEAAETYWTLMPPTNSEKIVAFSEDLAQIEQAGEVAPWNRRQYVVQKLSRPPYTHRVGWHSAPGSGSKSYLWKGFKSEEAAQRWAAERNREVRTGKPEGARDRAKPACARKYRKSLLKSA